MGVKLEKKYGWCWGEVRETYGWCWCEVREKRWVCVKLEKRDGFVQM